jgi:hypothetical protein
LNRPAIRHPDLSLNNTFISESGDLTSVIDRQHSTIYRILLQVKIPKHFRNYGDEDSENFDFLTKSKNERVTELYRRLQLQCFYLCFNNRNNKAQFHAMGTHDIVVTNQLYYTAGRPWESDATSLKAGLMQASTFWPAAPMSALKDAKFPAIYTETEAT